MELVLTTGNTIAFDKNDLVTAGLYPNEGAAPQCVYFLRGAAAPGIVQGHKDAKRVYKIMLGIINDREQKRQSLAAYAAILEN